MDIISTSWRNGYKCNLCRACGDDLCASFQKARRVLVLKDKEMNANREMIDNLCHMERDRHRESQRIEQSN